MLPNLANSNYFIENKIVVADAQIATICLFKHSNVKYTLFFPMDFVRRISDAAAKSAVGTHDLQENKLITIVGALELFKTHVILLLKNDNESALLPLNKEYSAVFTEQDISDINAWKCQLFIIYKKKHHCRCDECYDYDIVSL
jgi:hypothetical protein